MESSEFTGKQEVTPSNSYLQGKKIGSTLNWADLYEEALSAKGPDRKTINQFDSYPPGIAIVEIPDGVDRNDFFDGLRDSMNTDAIYSNCGFMVGYSFDDQAKIKGGEDPSLFKENVVYFNVEEQRRSSGLPDYL